MWLSVDSIMVWLILSFFNSLYCFLIKFELNRYIHGVYMKDYTKLFRSMLEGCGFTEQAKNKIISHSSFHQIANDTLLVSKENKLIRFSLLLRASVITILT